MSPSPLPRRAAATAAGATAPGRRWSGLLGLMVLLLALLLPAAAATALSLADLPSSPPPSHVLDRADVLSRAGRADLERQLRELEADRVEARLLTVNHLEYGLDVTQLAEQLLAA